MSIFQRDLNSICEECEKEPVDSKEVIITGIVALLMVALCLVIIFWEPKQHNRTPTNISREQIKTMTTSQLAEYTYLVNEEMKWRAQQ